MTSALELAKSCSHKKTIPIDVISHGEDFAWYHWCTDCGSISTESQDIDQPKEPWTYPGELSDEHIERINRAARGED